MGTILHRQLAPLNAYEENILMPMVVKCLGRHIGRDQAITNRKMCEALQDWGSEVSGIRMRKIINYIRRHKLIKCLVASNRGYHVTRDKDEMCSYIASIQGRIDALVELKDALVEQLAEMT